MNARNIENQPLTEEQLSPHVVIAASLPERFSVFSELLDQNGYPCHVFDNIQDVLTQVNAREGVVVFFDWELPNTNTKSMVSLLTEKLGVDCIVFSDSEDVQSRAQLASCGFRQTIQPPYNEKNFLMAVQKIKTDRIAENDKILRKLRHQERIQQPPEEELSSSEAFDLMQEMAAEEEAEAQVFSNDQADTSSEHYQGEESIGGHTHAPGSMKESHLSLVQEAPESIEHSASTKDPFHDIQDLVQQGSGMQNAQEFTETAEEVYNSYQSSETPGADDELLASLSNEEKDDLVDSLVDQLEDMGDEDEDEFIEPSEETFHAESQVDSSKNFADEFAAASSLPELPPLPKVEELETPPPFNFKEAKEENFSGRDWFLLVSGIVVGLLLCGYILTHVFLLPMLQAWNA